MRHICQKKPVLGNFVGYNFKGVGKLQSVLDLQQRKPLRSLVLNLFSCAKRCEKLAVGCGCGICCHCRVFLPLLTGLSISMTDCMPHGLTDEVRD